MPKISNPFNKFSGRILIGIGISNMTAYEERLQQCCWSVNFVEVLMTFQGYDYEIYYC